MTNPESLIYWSDESQLMGYGESDSSGCWIKLQMHPEDMDKFRGIKGTVFHVTMVKIQDNGEPEKQQKPYADKPIGPLCREANDYCQNKDFQRFLQWYIDREIMPKLSAHYAAIAIRHYCCVTTKKALDYEKDEARSWGLLKEHYEAWPYRAKDQGRAAGI